MSPFGDPLDYADLRHELVHLTEAELRRLKIAQHWRLLRIARTNRILELADRPTHNSSTGNLPSKIDP